MPEIVVKQGTKVIDTHTLFQETIRIGRSRDNDVVLDHLSISRHHSEIRYDTGHWLVADLESANGTFVNGQRVTTVPLYHADTITLGKIHLHFFDTPVESDEMRIHDVADDCTMVLSSEAQPRGCLTVQKGKHRGKEYILDADRMMIGRAPDCDVQLNDWRVSKHHARVIRCGGDFAVEDMGTWGAIQINGVPAKESRLGDGDVLQVGGTRLSFRLIPPGATPIPAKRPEPAFRAHLETQHEGEEEAADPEIVPFYPKPAIPPEEPALPEDDTSQEGDGGIADEIAEAFADDDTDGRAKEASDPSEDEAVARDEGDIDVIEEETGEVAVEACASEEEPTNGSENDLPESEPSGDDPEIAMWLRAYNSGRPAMRRHAARQLERLTGRTYDV